MACMGPSKKYAEEMGEKLFQDFMKQLNSKGILVTPTQALPPIMAQEREKILKEFKNILSEIAFQELCESF